MTLQNQAKELLPFVQAMAKGKEVQVKFNDLWCKKVTSNFMPGEEYRIAPETIIVNGFEIEAPLKEAPQYGSKYYIPAPQNDEWYDTELFEGKFFDGNIVDRGLCHKTSAAAIAHAKAMIGVNPNE